MDQIFERDLTFGIEKHWHGKNTVVEKIDIDLAFNYDIKLAPLFLRYGSPDNPKFRQHIVAKQTADQTSGRMAGAEWHVPVCTDDGLPVGNGQPVNPKTYGLRPPREDFEFLERVLTDGGHRIVSAGTIRNRSQHFIVAELENSSVDIDHRHFGQYLNWLGSVDRSTSLMGVQSSTCTVCANTQRVNIALADRILKGKVKEALGGKEWLGAVRLSHRTKINEHVERVGEAIRASLVMTGVFEEALTALRDEPCTVDQAVELYTGFLAPEKVERKADLSTRTTNMIDDCVHLFRYGRGNEGENMLDALSGFTEFRTRGNDARDNNVRSKGLRMWASSEFGAFADEKTAFGSELVRDYGERIQNRGRAILTA